jgi:hypothetical protein
MTLSSCSELYFAAGQKIRLSEQSNAVIFTVIQNALPSQEKIADLTFVSFLQIATNV